jgi:hypothetical protein
MATAATVSVSALLSIAEAGLAGFVGLRAYKSRNSVPLGMLALVALGVSLDNLRRAIGGAFSTTVPDGFLWMSSLLDLFHLGVLPLTVLAGAFWANKSRPLPRAVRVLAIMVTCAAFVVGLTTWFVGFGTLQSVSHFGIVEALPQQSGPWTALGAAIPAIAGLAALVWTAMVWYCRRSVWLPFALAVVSLVGQLAVSAAGGGALFYGSNLLEPVFVLAYLSADMALSEAPQSDPKYAELVEP